jgi:hypothetical protein
LIEQRIPSKKQDYYSYSGSTTTIETKNYDSRQDEAAKLNTDEITNVNSAGSEGAKDYKTIKMPAATLRFEYSFWVYRLTILDKKKPVILKKNNFTNLPDYYEFEDIVIN